jgi:phosphate transport system substrate-binding protein
MLIQMPTRRVFPMAVLFSLILAGARPATPQPSTVITVDGSSTVFPITEGAAAEFQRETQNTVRVAIRISGTGGGFRKFCAGQTDVQDASRPILKEEMEACARAGVQYVELPIGFDALTVAVSPSNTWLRSMTVADLKKMWEPAAQGRVTRWSQVRPAWPDVPFKLYGADADSGTFDYFTEAVVGKAKASRTDYSPSEDDNVLVQGIVSDPNALGYIPYAYFEPNKRTLRAVAIDAGKGPVSPLLENVVKGVYEPLARPLFLYVNARSAERVEVRQFVTFYLQHAGKLVTHVKYVPLPDRAYAMARDRFVGRRLGTAFHGSTAIGLRIEDIVQREPRL